MGELRYNQEDQGLWARYINNKLNWDGRNNFDTTMKTLQVGYDKKETGTKRDWYYGGAIEHTWGSSEYAGCGDGKQHLTDIALYATQIGNKGHYLDLVTKVATSALTIRPPTETVLTLTTGLSVPVLNMAARKPWEMNGLSNLRPSSPTTSSKAITTRRKTRHRKPRQHG